MVRISLLLLRWKLKFEEWNVPKKIAAVAGVDVLGFACLSGIAFGLMTEHHYAAAAVCFSVAHLSFVLVSAIGFSELKSRVLAVVFLTCVGSIAVLSEQYFLTVVSESQGGYWQQLIASLPRVGRRQVGPNVTPTVGSAQRTQTTKSCDQLAENALILAGKLREFSKDYNIATQHLYDEYIAKYQQPGHGTAEIRSWASEEYKRQLKVAADQVEDDFDSHYKADILTYREKLAERLEPGIRNDSLTNIVNNRKGLSSATPLAERSATDLERLAKMLEQKCLHSRVVSPQTRASASAMKLTFKESPSFTPARKERIASQISNFRTYLLAIGFDVPPECPPIGASETRVPVSSYLDPGTIYESAFFIPVQQLDDPETVTAMYGQYVFHKLFPPPTQPQGRFSTQFMWVYNDYYVSSFFGKYRVNTSSSFAYWTNGLWDMRTKYGKSFADRLLYYAFATWYPPQPKDTFDQFFWRRISHGLTVLSNTAQEFEAPAWKIFKARGAPLEAIAQ